MPIKSIFIAQVMRMERSQTLRLTQFKLMEKFGQRLSIISKLKSLQIQILLNKLGPILIQCLQPN